MSLGNNFFEHVFLPTQWVIMLFNLPFRPKSGRKSFPIHLCAQSLGESLFRFTYVPKAWARILLNWLLSPTIRVTMPLLATLSPTLLLPSKQPKNNSQFCAQFTKFKIFRQISRKSVSFWSFTGLYSKGYISYHGRKGGLLPLRHLTTETLTNDLKEMEKIRGGKWKKELTQWK